MLTISFSMKVNGPIREYYLEGPHTGAPASAWKTRIGWPIFRTSARAGD